MIVRCVASRSLRDLIVHMYVFDASTVRQRSEPYRRRIIGVSLMTTMTRAVQALEHALQSLLVLPPERHVVVRAELAVVRRIDEDEVVTRRRGLGEERLEVQAAPLGCREPLEHGTCVEQAHLVAQRLAVVGDATVRDVELAARVEAEHGREGELAQEEEVGGAVRTPVAAASRAVVASPDRHVHGGTDGALDVREEVGGRQQGVRLRLDAPHALEFHREVLLDSRGVQRGQPRTGTIEQVAKGLPVIGQDARGRRAITGRERPRQLPVQRVEAHETIPRGGHRFERRAD